MARAHVAHARVKTAERVARARKPRRAPEARGLVADCARRFARLGEKTKTAAWPPHLHRRSTVPRGRRGSTASRGRISSRDVPLRPRAQPRVAARRLRERRARRRRGGLDRGARRAQRQRHRRPRWPFMRGSRLNDRAARENNDATATCRTCPLTRTSSRPCSASARSRPPRPRTKACIVHPSRCARLTTAKTIFRRLDAAKPRPTILALSRAQEPRRAASPGAATPGDAMAGWHRPRGRAQPDMRCAVILQASTSSARRTRGDGAGSARQVKPGLHVDEKATGRFPAACARPYPPTSPASFEQATTGCLREVYRSPPRPAKKKPVQSGLWRIAPEARGVTSLYVVRRRHRAATSRGNALLRGVLNARDGN